MAELVADVVLARLREWGVRQVFGYPGDGINGLLAAWGRAKDDPQFVQARHEEMAAFMASAYAKFAGEMGVCLATGGPGATHLITVLIARKGLLGALLSIDNQARIVDLARQHYGNDVIITGG